jgi:PAS domain S-box-containing protein
VTEEILDLDSAGVSAPLDGNSRLRRSTDAVRLKQSEQDLRASEERYRSLFESIDEGFCIIEKIGGEGGEPLDFRYVEVNPAFAVHTGLSVVVGTTLRQVIPDEFEEWITTYDSVIQTGESIRFERGLVSQGRVLELHAFRIEDRMLRRVGVNFRDITERKRTEEQLRSNHHTFFNLIENSPFGLYIVNAQFRLHQVSTASQKVFSQVRPLIGRDFEEVLRQLWAEPFASEAIARFRHTLATGEPHAAPNTTEQRNDIPDVESYDWKIERIMLPDGQFGVACYFYDITERIEAEQAMRESVRELRETEAELRATQAALFKEKAALADHVLQLQQVNQDLLIATFELTTTKAAAEKASLAKSDFLSKMSHELRTPLNAILGFAQLLERDSPPPTPGQTARLQQIIQAGWYLLELINEILDLAVIESGRLSLSREPVSLIDIMRECHAMIEPQAQKCGIHMNFLPFDHTWYAHADRTRVKQVLINLLSNAIKYNREHGSVEVKCTASPERIRISIKDSGMGLPPEKLVQLFQPFNRLGQETGAEEGTGIGLVVTKQLVELMGGTIGVESTVGVGSEFWIELIRDDVTPQLAAGPGMLAERAPQAQENTALRTLLYVEDNPANLELVEQIIEGYPYLRMLSARDGNLGIALARAHLPDVILMDITLPDINGIEAMEILRKDPLTAHIPVVALSANATPHNVLKGMEAGFFRYVCKPFELNEFMCAIDEALTFRKSRLASTDNTEALSGSE